MKRISKIIAFVMLFSIIGCENFLNLEPENDIIQSDYWKTEDDVYSVMMSSYVTLRDAHKQIFDWGEMRSDGLEIFSSNKEMSHWFLARRGEITETFGSANWASMYTMIGYSNLLLENIPGVMEYDTEFYPSEARAYIAEAKTLRALAYFYLVRTFREVPLILDAYETDGKEITVAKSSEEEIIAQIIKDLKEAIPDMRPTYSLTWQNFGRATKLLSMTLLADVYLYNENYQECADMCSGVLSDNTRTLIRRSDDLEYIPGDDDDPDDIRLNNSWLNIFFKGNTNESIFEIQFAYSRNQTNDLFHYFFDDEFPILIPNSFNMNDLYEVTDIRKAVIEYERDFIKNNGIPEHFLLKYMGFRSASGGVSDIEDRPDRNIIIYRLAEVYLMRAEAYACLGDYDKALADINVIRERASATPASISSSKNDFEDYILEERARELMGEGKSWFDLLRIARRNNYERKDILIEKLLFGVEGVNKPVMESMLQETNAYYLPILKSELDRNVLLVQNPYYE